MKLRIILRVMLTIVFGFIGAYVGNNVVLFEIFGDYYLVVSVFVFGIFGFILPEIGEFVGKAGIAALAVQIIGHLPNPTSGQIRTPFNRRKKKASKSVPTLVLDTSALIDGRIIEVVRTGFVNGTFLVLPSVISELQQLADSANDLKRVRGRRGLDNLEALTLEKQVKVQIASTEPKDSEVDTKLVVIAKQIKGKVVTVDFNLNKVAKVRGVKVLNVNELASAVRTPVLPNEKFNIQVSAVGSGKDQGVGYLADGTMVVIENGAKLVGRAVDVVVMRVLQTPAGKMVFAKQAPQR